MSRIGIVGLAACVLFTFGAEAKQKKTRPTITIVLCENGPTWWSDIREFQIQIATRKALGRFYFDERFEAWATRNDYFKGQQVRWTLSRKQVSVVPITERSAMQRYLAYTKIVEDHRRRPEQAPKGLLRQHAKSRSHAAAFMAERWKKLIENPQGYELRYKKHDVEIQALVPRLPSSRDPSLVPVAGRITGAHWSAKGLHLVLDCNP